MFPVVAMAVGVSGVAGVIAIVPVAVVVGMVAAVLVWLLGVVVARWRLVLNLAIFDRLGVGLWFNISISMAHGVLANRCFRAPLCGFCKAWGCQ